MILHDIIWYYMILYDIIWLHPSDTQKSYKYCWVLGDHPPTIGPSRYEPWSHTSSPVLWHKSIVLKHRTTLLLDDIYIWHFLDINHFSGQDLSSWNHTLPWTAGTTMWLCPTHPTHLAVNALEQPTTDFHYCHSLESSIIIYHDSSIIINNHQYSSYPTFFRSNAVLILSMM